MNPDFPAAVPEIPVRDINKAVEYYEKNLGFKIDWGGEDGGIAGISKGHCRIFLTNPSFREPYGNSGPVFLVQSQQQGRSEPVVRAMEGHAGKDRFCARGEAVEIARIHCDGSRW
jgi:catechol 2,3-dioxygenase-like lactoylglutathione lyase family enzyme